MKSRGQIVVMYTVVCGGCEETIPFDTLTTSIREAAYDARQFGWVNSRLRGWLCPECQATEKREKSETKRGART